jgi:hypothetical protein
VHDQQVVILGEDHVELDEISTRVEGGLEGLFGVLGEKTG